MIRLFAILFLLVLSCSAWAAPARFVVRVWQSDAGLPGNAVRSVAQAADGYLWVATAEGIVRFDGVRFSGFNSAEESALSALPARNIFPVNGEVWVGLDRGALLRWREGKLTRVLAESATAGAFVSQVVPFEGDIAVVRGAECWRIRADGSVATIERTPALDALLVADAEEAVAKGRAPASGGTPQLRDQEGRRWQVEVAGGLTVTETDGAVISVPLAEPAYRISELAEDRDGSIWAATADSGLAQIRAARVQMLGVEDGLSDRVVTTVIEGRDGSMWLGNKGGRVDRIGPDGIQHYTLGDGSRAVAALMEDSHGAIWAATRHGSVFRFEDGVFQLAFPSLSSATQTQAMVMDREGRLWFGGLRGLSVLEAGDARPVPLGDEAEEITALGVDEENRVWAGTRKGRIWRGKLGDWKLLEPAPNRMITGLSPARGYPKDGAGMYVSTLGAGLWYIAGNSNGHHLAMNHLPDLRLTAVANGTWLGSLAGILRRSRGDTGLMDPWIQLDRSDGLSVRECSGLGQPSCWTSRDGRLWFPTVNGVAIINPSAFRLHTQAPITRLESLSINGEEQILDGKPITVGPGLVGLELRFTGLSFSAPEKVRFSYQLQGLEDGWRQTGNRTVSYPALPPGRYTFHVRAINGDWVRDPDGVSQVIIVRPYFWQTVWFRAVAIGIGALMAAGLGLLMARIRWRRKMARLEIQHAREAERARIARDLHDELGASLTEISLLANVTAEEESSPPVRASLEEIATKAQTIVGALDEIVWAVNPRHDTLASLADYVAAFAMEFLSTAEVTLRLDMPKEYPAVAVEAERRHALLLAVRETLNNVVKHADAREVWLRLRLPENAVEIEISDDGKGFELSAAAAGEGLRNLRERLSGLGGQCAINSRPGGGTSVVLRLPLAGRV